MSTFIKIFLFTVVRNLGSTQKGEISAQRGERFKTLKLEPDIGCLKQFRNKNHVTEERIKDI